MTQIHAALALAQELSHAFRLAFALNYASMLHAWRQAVPLAKARAEAVITLASEHGFIHPMSVGMIRRGWALPRQGAVAEGIGQLNQGLVTIREAGTMLPLSHHLALLAEPHTLVEQHEERVWEAEVHRLRGVLLLRQTLTSQKEAEACFQQALTVARRQQARALELRAAMSLARLWQQQGKCTKARELLASVYGWFTEGFDTADL